jgi:hypothetical protein
MRTRRSEGDEATEVPVVDNPVLIDCDSCEVRGLACGDCVVTALLGAPPEGVLLDAEERRALDVLAGSGLVPPLRLVRPEAADASTTAGSESENRQQRDSTRFVS